MPALPTQSFATIVQNTAAGIQGRASALVNFAIGSTLRAIAEGFGGLFLWFQALVLQLLTAIRLSTASGNDVDTFTADFMPVLPGSQSASLPGGSPRLGAQAASGQVTFTRFTAGPSSPFVPVGTTMQTADGTQNFTVTADATYPTFNVAANGYIMPAGITTLIVPAEAVTPGSGGNVVAGAISVMTSSLTGIDQVTNVAAFENGANQESDSALKARFAAYILGLSRGDNYGLTASIEGTAITVQWTLTESYNLDGSWHPGFFFIIADDGSGAPSPTFLTAVSNAAQAVRPLGMQFSVFAPTVVNATVSMTIAVASGYVLNTVTSQVAATIANNINALGLGNPLEFGMLYSWAYSVAGVTNVTAVLLNGLSGDSASLTTTKLTQDGVQTINYKTIKAGSVVVS
jgi:uncharacterized phage protein gp47/JayE